MKIEVRPTQAGDIPAVQDLCRRVYVDSPPWSETQLLSHQQLFPAGQFVAVDEEGHILGMAASLIIRWDDYDFTDDWRDFTDQGMFTNHDPEEGKTLYGAEVMVHPQAQGQGIGTALYQAREVLCRSLGLLRIRAGARLRGYHQYNATLTPAQYVEKVVAEEIFDPTLSFQIKKGFRVLKVVSGYLRHDRESLGYAAVIEWLNPEHSRNQS